MTRDEVLAKVKTLVEGSNAKNEAAQVIRMALDGIPAQQILDAYLFALQWNEEALMAGLKQAEAAIEEMLAADERKPAR